MEVSRGQVFMGLAEELAGLGDVIAYLVAVSHGLDISLEDLANLPD
jgi:hypothetical protein